MSEITKSCPHFYGSKTLENRQTPALRRELKIVIKLSPVHFHNLCFHDMIQRYLPL